MPLSTRTKARQNSIRSPVRVMHCQPCHALHDETTHSAAMRQPPGARALRVTSPQLNASHTNTTRQQATANQAQAIAPPDSAVCHMAGGARSTSQQRVVFRDPPPQKHTLHVKCTGCKARRHHHRGVDASRQPRQLHWVGGLKKHAHGHTHTQRGRAGTPGGQASPRRCASMRVRHVRVCRVRHACG
jgi:hypothetical protein